MMCLSVISLCYRIMCLWFCNKRFYNKKGRYSCCTLYRQVPNLWDSFLCLRSYNVQMPIFLTSSLASMQASGLGLVTGFVICCCNSTHSVPSNNTFVISQFCRSVVWAMSDWAQHLRYLAMAAVSSEAQLSWGLLPCLCGYWQRSVFCGWLGWGLLFLPGSLLKATLSSLPVGLSTMAVCFLKGKMSLWKVGIKILRNT